MKEPEYEQIIIGAGFAGICMAIKLKQAGMSNFIILERNCNLGGTWWDNAYPGAACDVESHLYSYSFKPNAVWSRQFSPQGEILDYLERCAAKYEVEKHLHLNCEVSQTIFDEAAAVWVVNTTTGKAFSARMIILCTGGLSQPALPDIKGLENFKGEMFHTARWDKSFDLAGKTVAVIGTGASAIQIVPAIAPVVKQLYLFQRTPPWIIAKDDKLISNFRKTLYKYLPFTRALHRWRLYWLHELMAIGFVVNVDVMKLFGKIALRYLKKSVKDETLRKKLTPNYIIGCKRILLSNDYYPALQRDNVAVVTESIETINETGVLTNQQQYPVDAIILATGFKAAEGVIPFTVKGKNSEDLNEAWRNGAEAYLGTSVSGFPNLFLVVGPNTGLGHSSMILMIEAQVHYIMECIQFMKKRNIKSAEVTKATQANFNTDLQKQLAKTVWQSGGCHSWYQNKNGKNVTLWPGFTFTFMRRTKRFEPGKYELVE